MLEYERIGVNAAHRELGRISASVLLARKTVREALGITDEVHASLSLETVVETLHDAEVRGELAVDDELAADLIAGLAPAIQLIKGNPAYSPPQRRGAVAGAAHSSRLVTLSGVTILK
jgi:hypothetical protein